MTPLPEQRVRLAADIYGYRRTAHDLWDADRYDRATAPYRFIFAEKAKRDPDKSPLVLAIEMGNQMQASGLRETGMAQLALMAALVDHIDGDGPSLARCEELTRALLAKPPSP